MIFLPYSKPKSGWFTKRIAEFYEAGTDRYPKKIRPATIAVENISGPIFLSPGSKDDIWPTAFMASEIEKWLQTTGFSFEIKHLHFAEAGHAIFGLLPAQHDEQSMNAVASGGGTTIDNHNARKQTWIETFAFFKKDLGE